MVWHPSHCNLTVEHQVDCSCHHIPCHQGDSIPRWHCHVRLLRKAPRGPSPPSSTVRFMRQSMCCALSSCHLHNCILCMSNLQPCDFCRLPQLYKLSHRRRLNLLCLQYHPDCSPLQSLSDLVRWDFDRIFGDQQLLRYELLYVLVSREIATKLHYDLR